MRESLEQRAVLVTEHVGAPRVVEVDRAHHAPAQVYGHAHDRAQAQVEHARRARLRIARGVRDQQAAAALGDALDHAPAVADRVAPRVGVHRAVLGHGGEDAALGVREQQHAALGVELLDREAHRAAGQLAEVADRVEQPADGAEQVARPGGARLAGSDAAQPVHREGERLLAAAMVAEPLETRGRELEPRAHRGARFAIAREQDAGELERGLRPLREGAEAPEALERAARGICPLGHAAAGQRELGAQRLGHGGCVG